MLNGLATVFSCQMLGLHLSWKVFLFSINKVMKGMRNPYLWIWGLKKIRHRVSSGKWVYFRTESSRWAFKIINVGCASSSHPQDPSPVSELIPTTQATTQRITEGFWKVTFYLRQKKLLIYVVVAHFQGLLSGPTDFSGLHLREGRVDWGKE